MEKKMKVLIAYDGAHPIEYFIQDLERAGLPAHADVLVFKVVEAYVPPAEGFTDLGIPESSFVYIEAMQEAAEARNKKQLSLAAKMCFEAAESIKKSFREWSVSSEVCMGSPSSAIIKKADEWKPDLVVIGSHGASAGARFFLGSVARSVFLHCKCSVRIVRKQAKKSEFVRIVIGMDGSHDAEMAVRTVSNRCWPKGTRVRLVTGFDQHMAYVMAFNRLPASKKINAKEIGEEAWIRRMTAPYAERLENAGLRVSDVIKAGKPWKILTGEAEKWKADCIFVGARGLGEVSRLLLGSVSDAISSRATCSVEVVRPKK